MYLSCIHPRLGISSDIQLQARQPAGHCYCTPTEQMGTPQTFSIETIHQQKSMAMSQPQRIKVWIATATG